MERTLLCRQWSAKVTNFYKTLPVLNGMVLRWSTLVNNDNVFYEQDFDLWYAIICIPYVFHVRSYFFNQLFPYECRISDIYTCT